MLKRNENSNFICFIYHYEKIPLYISGGFNEVILWHTMYLFNHGRWVFHHDESPAWNDLINKVETLANTQDARIYYLMCNDESGGSTARY